MEIKHQIDQSELKRLINYDCEAGTFNWIVSRGRVKAGSLAGRANKSGYWQIQVLGRLYSAHRLAWLYHYGRWPLSQIDHIDRDPLNNRISNLRECTNRGNGQNKSSAIGSSSKYVGVNWNKLSGKWVASISINGEKRHIGLFEYEIDAAKAYLQEKKRIHKFNPILANYKL